MLTLSRRAISSALSVQTFLLSLSGKENGVQDSKQERRWKGPKTSGSALESVKTWCSLGDLVPGGRDSTSNLIRLLLPTMIPL